MPCDKAWSVGCIRKSLKAPYNGLYKVLQCLPKYFFIEMNDNIYSSSVNRMESYVETFIDKSIFHNCNNKRFAEMFQRMIVDVQISICSKTYYSKLNKLNITSCSNSHINDHKVSNNPEKSSLAIQIT